MNTGTPLDLTPFGAVLQAIGAAYWLLALAAMAAALWFPKRWWVKATAALVVAAAFAYVPGKRDLELRAKQREFQARYEAARAHFEERCKSAGEKITRTIENVDGIFWMTWRPKEANFDDQFRLSDPYGWDCGGEECIQQMLRVSRGLEHASKLWPSQQAEVADRQVRGYNIVETIDPGDGRLYQYRWVIKPIGLHTPQEIQKRNPNASANFDPNIYGFGLERTSVSARSARYGVTWDDISTREDREKWIAGSSLRVIDLQTNEVIAERIGFLLDRGQGSKAGGRSPWPWAQGYGPSCPATKFPINLPFINKVLNPSK